MLSQIKTRYENAFERYCQWQDKRIIRRGKKWWTWWRPNISEWHHYDTYGRKVFDIHGAQIKDTCMRRYRDGCWEYREFDKEEADRESWWHAIR